MKEDNKKAIAPMVEDSWMPFRGRSFQNRVAYGMCLIAAICTLGLFILNSSTLDLSTLTSGSPKPVYGPQKMTPEEVREHLAVIDKGLHEYMLMKEHPEIDWFWWMDSDAIFTDMTFELPLHKYENYNMVMHGWDDAVYEKRSWLGLNAGVFLIRNCQWSMDLLHAWAPMSPKGKIRDDVGKFLSKALPDRGKGEADDQSGLVYLMITDRERWGSKVYLESSYYFQGYWKVLTEKFEDMMAKYKPGIYGDDRWPFVTHFCGCEFCCGAINPEYTVDRCLTQMERAVNFADNQVLERYGFIHKSLKSAEVESREAAKNRTAKASVAAKSKKAV